MRTVQKIFMDTEFDEDSETIRPLSLGFYAPCYNCKGKGSVFPTRAICNVCGGDKGQGLYVVITDADRTRCNEFVKEHVVPYLDVEPEGATTIRCTKAEAGRKILSWINTLGPAGNRVEFWAYFGDYDWVLFAQLFGTMSDLPPYLPQICLDLKQELMRRGYMRKSEIPELEGLQIHNAYDDALWNFHVDSWLNGLKP